MDEVGKKTDRDDTVKAAGKPVEEAHPVDRIFEPEKGRVGRIVPRLSMEHWAHAFNRRFW